MKKDHDFADYFLVCPAGRDFPDPLGADPADLFHPLGLFLNDFKDIHTEGADETLRAPGADPLHHAGAKVFLNPLKRGGRMDTQKLRPKLPPVLLIHDPAAKRGRVFAGGD